jgi:hypothetical protein
MAERDRFELDLATALRRYAEDAPTQVRPLELARHLAAAHPHRRSGIGQWRLAAVPRLTWILLMAALLTALLTALLAGTLFVGSQVQRRLPAVVPPVVRPVLPAFICPPGSTPDAPGPANQARPSDGGPMAFDRAAGKIVMLAGAETWTFDVCTNAWTLMQTGLGAVPDTELALAYDAAADLIVAVDNSDAVAGPPRAWTYDLDANTWTRQGPAPDHVVRLWHDAASARVGAWATRSDTEPGTIWAYDGAADTWAVAGELEVRGGYGWNTPGNDLLAYDAGLDRVVATVTGTPDGSGVPTRLFDMHTGAVVDEFTVAPWAGQCGWMALMYCYGGAAGAAIAYDEHASRTVVLIAGYLFGYDAAGDRWETLYGPGATDSSDAEASASAASSALVRESWSMVSDPVNGRLVVLGGMGGAILAFDATTREWTVLLDPSRAQPTPTP